MQPFSTTTSTKDCLHFTSSIEEEEIVADPPPESQKQSIDIEDIAVHLKLYLHIMSSTEEKSNGVGGEDGTEQSSIVANGDGEPANDAPSITAVLEAANTLRKVDEKVNEILADTTPVAAVANGNGSSTSTQPPTIDDIANALSEPNNLVYTAEDDDDDDSLPDDIVGSSSKPAYSSQTAAAISYLMKGETTESSSLLFSSNSNNNNNSNRQSSKEISLQDRASAMISVYKDYIVQQQEEEEEEQQEHELSLEERRKEEIKLFTLEKFCGDNTENNNQEQDGGEEEYDNDDEVGSDDAAAYDEESDDMSIDSHEKLNGRSKIDKSKSKKPRYRKPRLHVPTAASTTAAFRLKAEVALKAVGDTAKKAGVAVAVKTKGGRHLKKKTKDGMQDDDDMNMAETIENEHDYQDYVTRDYDDDIAQDEMQDDLEYGIQHQHQIRINEDGTEDGGIYGMHILDRDKSLKRTRRLAAAQDENNNDPDVEAVGIFNDLCDELGVTPDTHPGLHNGLHHFYHQPRSTRYKYPIFRTKKFKKAMFGALLLLLVLLIGVAIISAVSNGFETVRQKKAPPLPDWKSEMDWEEQQKLKWEADHPTTASGTNISRPTHPAITSQQKLFQKVSAAYRPVWYDRSTGWTGQTYAESITWCDSHDNYIPCPYEVYCPDEKNLLSGIMDEEGESWAPVVNSENEWVQVGNAAGVCDLYSNRYGERPIWGTNGVNDEKITRHVMCCREHPMEEGGKPADGEHNVIKADAPPDNWHVFESATKTYNPIWFDRDKGWKGQTYQDSLDFCAKQVDGYMPCPLDAYCPGGRGKLLGGIQENEGESWSAVIDTANDWVQVGAGGECSLYSETAKELPSWGITGENNEEITRHIMCCDVLGKLLSGDESSTAAEDSNISAPPLVILPKPHRPMTELEVRVTETHHPAWFSTDSGYKGTTYNDARAFCESIPVGEGDTYHLCPLSAYCPNGPTDTEPLYLQQKSFEGVQWAPISNEENGWIMIGTFNEQPQLTCQTYLEIHNSGPEWGLDGTSPELKTNILCCKGETAEVQDSSSNNSQNTASLPDSQNDEQPASNNEEPASIMKPASVMSSSEIQIQDTYHPAWFSKAFGWQGTTYNDARAFCESIPNGDGGSTLHLCPFSAYCPNGPRETEPLYLHMEAFDGVQWAPISNEENEWVMIGDTADLTCKTYLEINHHEPSWGLDGDETQLKEHLLCCEDKTFNANAVASIQEGSLSSVSNSDIQVDGSLTSTPDASNNQGGHESSVISTFNPQWFTADNGGWDGGSHSEAVQFCQQFAGSHGKKMELCPYAVYCPNGPSNSVIGGHDANFDEEGEQWAPVFGQANHWVMIGKKGTNKSTTCLSHVQLTGEEPSWGIDGSSKEKKLHIMCCSPLQ